MAFGECGKLRFKTYLSDMKYKDLAKNFSKLISIGRPFAPRLVATFTTSFPVISCNDVAVVELEKFRLQIEGLSKDEVFVLGRLADTDFNLQKVFMPTGGRPTGVSRYHCYVKKEKDGVFGLYDISATFTAVRLD